MPFWPLSSVRAKATITDASLAPVMKILLPLRTYSSPKRFAVVFIAPASEPELASLSA